MSIDEIKTHIENYYSNGIIIPEECIEELIDCLDELKIFKELYPDINTENSLKNNYLLGVKDFVIYLNNTAFGLRHDMDVIEKYADKFIQKQNI